MSCVFDSITVSTIRSLLARREDPVVGYFDDGIGQLGRLYFGRAPAEFDFSGDAVGLQIALRRGHQFRRDDFACRSLTDFTGEDSGTAKPIEPYRNSVLHK